jgi:hypothetical protein
MRDLNPSFTDDDTWTDETFKPGERLMVFSQRIVDIGNEGMPAATPNYLYIVANGKARSARKGHDNSSEPETDFRKRLENRKERPMSNAGDES